MAVTMFITAVLTTLVLSCSVVHAGPDDCSPLPAPANGGVQLAYSKKGQLLAVFSCDTDYAALGQTVLSCDNGQWDKIPPLCASLQNCELDDKNSQDDVDESLLNHCPKLKSPRYGRMDSDLHRGSLDAYFNCYHGYVLDGPKNIHCENGVWDSQEPDCKPVDCGSPESPINGTVEVQDTHYTARAYYKCNTCQQLTGYENRVCKRSGQWSKTTPICVPTNDVARCEIPDITGSSFIQNKNSLVTNGTACGEDLTIRCFSGQRLSGANTATCNPDGTYTWHGVTPRCRRLRWTR